MDKRIRVIFNGRVQGVGFRYTARSLAGKHPVTGYVRNLDNGDVELVAEGSEDHLSSFMKDVQRAMSPHILKTQVVWEPHEGTFKQFEISY